MQKAPSIASYLDKESINSANALDSQRTKPPTEDVVAIVKLLLSSSFDTCGILQSLKGDDDEAVANEDKEEDDDEKELTSGAITRRAILAR